MFKISINMVGKIIGRLTVVSRAGNTASREAMWECRCSCGNTTIVRGSKLRSKEIKSCGCGRVTHGKSKTGAYKSWQNMLARCNNPNDTTYHGYGAKGVSVCRRWHKFENFYADMGDRPKGKSIDRINNYLGYSEKNCRWLTNAEQQENKKTSVRCIINGKRYPAVSAASRDLGIPFTTIIHRLKVGKAGYQRII